MRGRDWDFRFRMYEWNPLTKWQWHLISRHDKLVCKVLKDKYSSRKGFWCQKLKTPWILMGFWKDILYTIWANSTHSLLWVHIQSQKIWNRQIINIKQSKHNNKSQSVSIDWHKDFMKKSKLDKKKKITKELHYK